MDYATFLARKAQANDGAGFEPLWLPDFLFDFQADLTSWAIRQGRAALFADCGLGKTPMALVWAINVHRHTGRRVLVAAPLGVARQLEREAAKFGIDAGVTRDGRPADAPISITNYERLEHFDPADFGGMVCDESSAIKAFDGKRRAVVTEFMRTLRYRLLATATAAPNDYTELGTSSEALGWLGHMDMLGRFFVNDNNTSHQFKGAYRTGGRPAEWAERNAWRFKGHAEVPFWRWVASWARAMRRPSDLGYDDSAFVLPPLELRETTVAAEVPRGDTLFDTPAVGLREEREELRHTLIERCEAAAKQLADADVAVSWCHLNDESRLLTDLIDGAVQLTGAESVEAKEEKLSAFTDGQIRVLVTKPSIAGWGLNWQHCNRLSYFPNHSYEQYYQAIRRFHRFGQDRPVTVDLITTAGGSRTLANLQRKAAAADVMFDALVTHMCQAQVAAPRAGHDQDMEVPQWLR
jgi:hypothetical protein